MRDDRWLFAKLDEVWDKYFSDVPQENDVRIVWGRRTRNRLGSIKQVAIPNPQAPNNKHVSNLKIQKLNENCKLKIENYVRHPETIITINSLFKDANIPEYVVIGTIAHELAHYTHGFHSPLEQRFATPHAGGVVHQEMENRGLGEIHRQQKRWLKANWRNYLEQKLPRKKPRRRKVIIRWI